VSGVSILVTTIDTRGKAQSIARAALAEKLAACVQITPIESFYVWKGASCEDAEYRLEIKHRSEDYPALAALVRRLHGYETPEILRLDATEADPAYRAWLQAATRRD
jgi:periplasmic divalent cation tolerance protein